MLSILMKSLTFLSKRTGESDRRLYQNHNNFGDSWGGISDPWGGGGGISPLPPFCMKHCLGSTLWTPPSIVQHHPVGQLDHLIPDTATGGQFIIL